MGPKTKNLRFQSGKNLSQHFGAKFFIIKSDDDSIEAQKRCFDPETAHRSVIYGELGRNFGVCGKRNVKLENFDFELWVTWMFILSFKGATRY